MVQGPRVASLIASSAPDEFPPWFAAEYVRGLTLTEYVAQYGPLPAELAAALGIGLAEALTAIHEAGILHRDLKPSNILLGRDGPKVIDFGLAALTAAPGDLTRTSETIGTPVCMAPEQVNSAKDLTTAADVYSLGAVLVFALDRALPVRAADGAGHAARDRRCGDAAGPGRRPGDPRRTRGRHARPRSCRPAGRSAR